MTFRKLTLGQVDAVTDAVYYLENLTDVWARCGSPGYSQHVDAFIGTLVDGGVQKLSRAWEATREGRTPTSDASEPSQTIANAFKDWRAAADGYEAAECTPENVEEDKAKDGLLGTANELAGALMRWPAENGADVLLKLDALEWTTDQWAVSLNTNEEVKPLVSDLRRLFGGAS
ncbi:hypothetical protein HBA54_03105 [Pelagibius litoralis]|uniref:Uncharacterized protein n=1 Tax=Pelagibius litoralis TaxID=374515 RepID=A0A967C356_9PROT|nr:hypothetical protein [Pelagibius litoralis]NIA67570.1 hypothetical protein [Pelagibius litoralis]